MGSAPRLRRTASHTFHKETRLRARKALQEQVPKVDGVSDLEFCLLEDNPLAAILEFAEEIEDGLVLLGSHGHGVIASVLLGSVAEGVVLKAEIPALIVAAPHRK